MEEIMGIIDKLKLKSQKRKVLKKILAFNGPDSEADKYFGSFDDEALKLFSDDKDVMLAFVSKNPFYLAYASDRLKSDPDLALTTLTAWPQFDNKIFAMVSDELRQNPKFVIEALKLAESPYDIGQLIYDQLTTNEEVAQAYEQICEATPFTAVSAGSITKYERKEDGKEIESMRRKNFHLRLQVIADLGNGQTNECIWVTEMAEAPSPFQKGSDEAHSSLFRLIFDQAQNEYQRRELKKAQEGGMQ